MEIGATADRQIRLKNKVLPVVLAFLLFQQLFHPYKSWTILLVGLGGAFVLGFLWARGLQRGLHFSREMRYGWAQVGDQLQERFLLENNSRFPAIWVTILDHSDLTGYQANTARFMEARSVKRWMKGGVCSRRGYYTLGPTELESGDPFGLFQVRVRYAHGETMLVVPPVIPLPSIQIASGDKVGEGAPRAYAPERTVTVAGVREYVPGDNLHSIHWLNYARRDDLYVHEFDSTPSSDWWIFLDMDGRVQIGEGEQATEEYAVILAGSIAERGLRAGRAVGLVAQGASPIWLPPRTGNGQRWAILQALATVKRGETSLAQLLANNQRTLGRNTSAIVISPSIERDWREALLGLSRRSISLTVLWLDPRAFGGEEDASSVLAALKAWGIHHHRVTPEIYEQPSIQNYFKWQKTARRRSSSTLTINDLDWRAA